MHCKHFQSLITDTVSSTVLFVLNPLQNAWLLLASSQSPSLAAKATLEEMAKRSIGPGKMADLIVLNGAPTKIPADEVKDIKVEMALLNGEGVGDKMS